MIGQTVAHYRIESRLGSGGMGIVYKAFDEQLQRPVALKFLPPHLSEDDDSKQRFMQEARAASALDHANICTVHHIGETEDGRLYIVMTFYEGQTLKYRLKQGPMDESTALDYARQIAAGLGRAHEAGMVHRDIKPANVMVTDRGEVKILDFGLAKLESAADLTRAGSTVGTAAYMSPEQTRGEKVGPASDVWSLGILLYEMLSGKRPFDAGYEQALAYAIANEEPAPVPGISPDAASLLKRLLAKSPSARPADGNAALAAMGGRPEAASRVADAAAAAPRRETSVGRLIGLFAVGSVLALAVVYAAMLQFGLPDWVLWLGVLLLAAGLPVLVYAARSESSRAKLDSGERRSLSGLPSWITVRRAWLGGGVAMIGLVLVAVAWMAMRAFGIGPAGTLLTRGLLTETDRVLVADFDDRTADGLLGRTIAEALRIDLAQSPVVSLLDASDVRAALARMQRDPADRLDATLAREIAQREGAKAVVTGEVAPLGTSYTINLRLLDAGTGDELVPLRETAESDATIVPAVDRLSAALRERIGESLRTIRSGSPLEQVSTPSLDALRHYTAGVEAFDAQENARAESELLRAIAIDSSFAMAYRKLAVLYNNLGTNPADLYRLSAKAYELRDRLPEEERFLTEAWYHSSVTRDEAGALRTYRAMLERFPEHETALNNASVATWRMGRLQESIDFAERGIGTSDAPFWNLYSNLIWGLADLGRYDAAYAQIDTMRSRFPGNEFSEYLTALVVGARTRDFASAADSVLAMQTRADDMAFDSFLRNTAYRLEAMLGHLDLVESLSRTASDAAAIDTDDRLWERIAALTARLHASEDREAVRTALEVALARFPLADMDPLDRPYDGLAYLRALLGDTGEARRLLDEQERLWPASWVRMNGLRHAALGMAALSDNDPGRAIDHFRDVTRLRGPDLLCHECGTYEMGLALRAADSLDTAARYLTAALEAPGIAPIFDLFGSRALSWRLLGDVNESLGRTDDAVAAYERFAELWADADPELQPQVEEIRGRINRLLAARAREATG